MMNGKPINLRERVKILKDLLRFGADTNILEYDNGSTAVTWAKHIDGRNSTHPDYNSIIENQNKYVYILETWQHTPRSLKHLIHKLIRGLNLYVCNSALMHRNSFDKECLF